MSDETNAPPVEVTMISKLDGILPPELEEYNANVVHAKSLEYEDEFKGAYGIDALQTGVTIIEPTYLPIQLELLCTENNALQPCIEAMVTNIDGTGYSVEPLEADKKESLSKEIESVEDFFNEPWPGESFVTLRKKIRRDLETTGNAYVEVLRNLKGEVMFLKHVESKTMRMVALDDSTVIEKEVKRGGKIVKINIALRERRYVQKVLSKYVYFKEFGSERVLDKTTGKWEEDTTTPVDRGYYANEIIHFTVNKDPRTPYGIPRWINQTPSVLGSRGAEEHNLTFFESGGIPPMLVFVHGGALTPAAHQAIQNVFAAKGSIKHKGAVIEAHSTSGSLDNANNVRVTVERFGAERQQDSMFEKYDDKCEQRIRRSFRLPPLFVGKSDDYSYATAFASYTVAEAQVFAPERDEFDEIINLKLMPVLTDAYQEITFKSMPLSVKDATQQMEAITLASTNKAISGEELVNALNEVVNMDLEYDEEGYDANKLISDLQSQIQSQGKPPQDQPAGDKDAPPEEANNPTPALPPKVAKSEFAGIQSLAEEAALLIHKKDAGTSFGKLMQNVATLSKVERKVFKSLLAQEMYGYPHHDAQGAEEIAYDTLEALATEDA